MGALDCVGIGEVGCIQTAVIGEVDCVGIGEVDCVQNSDRSDSWNVQE